MGRVDGVVIPFEKTTWMVCGWKFGLISFGGRKIVWLQKQCVFSPPEALPFVLRFFDVAMLEFA